MATVGVKGLLWQLTPVTDLLVVSRDAFTQHALGRQVHLIQRNKNLSNADVVLALV